MKVYLKALGCRLNEAELMQWGQDFSRSGVEVVGQIDDADVVVLNSCAVTQAAGKKSRQMLSQAYRKNPNAKLVATGCYASLGHEGLAPPELAEHFGVDLIVSNQEKDQLPDKVVEHFKTHIAPQDQPIHYHLFEQGRQRAFIKIQDGCRYKCTYCIVTEARGDERSVPVERIISQIRHFHQSGIQEVVLTGVHVGGYGSDIGMDLSELLMQVLEQTSIPRIRFASVEPWDLSPAFIAQFAHTRVMPHLHLPIQSGADSVLRRMSRRCKVDEFKQLITQLKQIRPEFNVTTDIIVGFPGETEEEWAQTVDFTHETALADMHIFSFSAREGTKAATLSGRVPEAVKKLRSQQLHQMALKNKQAFLEKQIGCEVEVLWEQQIETEEGLILQGYTPNYCRVQGRVHERRHVAQVSTECPSKVIANSGALWVE